MKRAMALSSMNSHSVYQLSAATDDQMLIEGRSESIMQPSQLALSENSRNIQNKAYNNEQSSYLDTRKVG